jgi:hypothetical protein
MSLPDRDLSWSSALESLIAQEGERCRGYSILHQKSEAYYSKRNNWIAIPVIILSTLSGTASVGSSSLFAGETQISSIVIGLVSISVGIMNTINSYYSFSRKSESHRIAYLHYNKLFQSVSIELSLPRQERIEPEILLKDIRSQMERLAETTPTPPDTILDDFTKRFKDYDKSIARPAETNGLSKVKIYIKENATPKEQVTLEIKNPMLHQNETSNRTSE